MSNKKFEFDSDLTNLVQQQSIQLIIPKEVFSLVVCDNIR